VKLRIITHNIMHLQGIELASEEQPLKRSSSGHGSLGLDIIGVLADFYNSLNPQIICLQEVPSLKDARKIADLVKMKVYFESGKSNPKYGGAILVNSSYESRKLSFPSLFKEMFERGCLMGHISGKNTSLTVCNLHLPSNIKRTLEEACYVRLKEVTFALSFLPEIIVGDFNERSDGPVYQKLKKAGYIDVAFILGKSEIPTCNNARIDYIWIHKKTNLKLAEYRVFGQPQLPAPLIEKIQAMSDHLPIMATFIYGKGDD